MPASFRISKRGVPGNGKTNGEIMRAMAQQIAHIKTTALTNPVNNVAASVAPFAGVTDAFVNVANAGTNLAQKAATETALGTVKNAIACLIDQSNTISASLGLAAITDSTGGTVSTPGTIPAVTQTTTAAATGAQATELNAIRANLNNAFYVLFLRARQIARAIGRPDPVLTFQGVPGATIPAISTGTGTAADPGVTKAAVDAALLKWANAAHTLAAFYVNACGADPGLAVIAE